MNRRQLLLGSVTGLCGAKSAAESSPEHVLQLDSGATRYTVSTRDKSVEDAIADVEFSIVEYNYRLTGRNNVGYAMADRDPTIPKRVARVFHFCNIEIAGQLLAAGEEYLLHMPCRLVVWQSHQTVWVASRLLPEQGKADKALVQRINTMMREIADFAVSE